MSPRKTPYKHPVKAHTRKERPVRKYIRGKGDQIKEAAHKRKISKGDMKTRLFNATLIYGIADEKFPIQAKDYLEGVDIALERRERKELPQKVRLREVM